MSYVAAVGAWWGLEAFAKAALTEDWMVLFFPEQFKLALAKKPRYIFFLNWSQMVPEDIVSRYECVNFHATPLPYGRGGHPIENMILGGHVNTVITAHRMTTALDEGPVYLQVGPVSLAGTKQQIQERFIEPVAAMMHHIVHRKPEPKPQQGEPTIFKRLSPDAYKQFWEARQ